MVAASSIRGPPVGAGAQAGTHSKPAVTALPGCAPRAGVRAATSLNKLWWRGKPTGATSEDGGVAAAYAPGPSATAPSPSAAGARRSEAPLPV